MDALWQQADVNQVDQVSLSYEEAITSPCQGCHALCCCYLPLQVLPARNLMEIDYIRYLLDFPCLVAGFSMGGQWSIYYVMPCRYLDLDNRRCKVHGTSEQPKTCVAYNEHDCWYYRAIRGEAIGFLHFDRHRFEQLLPLITFDRDRNITSVPSWDQMVDLYSSNPIGANLDKLQKGSGFVVPSPLVPNNGNDIPVRTLTELIMEDPCQQCAAPCCRYLFFPLPVPKSFMQIDFIQFCLNFPGIECAVGPMSWWLLLRADCEFFEPESKRCKLYGKPERPLHCIHLNQWDCVQYKQLLYPDSTSLLRMNLESFQEMTEQIKFDDNGYITHLPDFLQQ